MRDARRMILLWSMPIMNSWWDLKYLFVTMNVEEINDYIDDDNVSRYWWRIEKMTITSLFRKNEIFFLFFLRSFLQHFSFSSSSVYLIDRRWIWTIPAFFYLILLPHYHLLALDNIGFLSFSLSLILIHFVLHLMLPSPRSLDFHDVWKPGHNCNRPQPRPNSQWDVEKLYPHDPFSSRNFFFIIIFIYLFFFSFHFHSKLDTFLVPTIIRVYIYIFYSFFFNFCLFGVDEYIRLWYSFVSRVVSNLFLFLIITNFRSTITQGSWTDIHNVIGDRKGSDKHICDGAIKKNISNYNCQNI